MLDNLTDDEITLSNRNVIIEKDTENSMWIMFFFCFFLSKIHKKKKLILRIRKKQLKFLELIMRNEDLENLTQVGHIER